MARHSVLTGFRQASDCVGVQSDPRLCFKHPGEFVCHHSKVYKPDNLTVIADGLANALISMCINLRM